MCNDENWDIDDCRTKFESDEHWSLKKEFLNANKGRFRKERLLCLAQLFVNIQILRCRYPDEITRQVLELSKGIGQDYKTKQKERLQRTFVLASEAAGAKVRGEKSSFRSPEVSKIQTSPKTQELCTNQEFNKIQEFFINQGFPKAQEFPRTQEFSKILELSRTQEFPNIQELSKIEEFSKTQVFPEIQEFSKAQESLWTIECAKAVQEKKRCYRRLQRNRHNVNLVPQLEAEYHQARTNAQRILRNDTKCGLSPVLINEAKIHPAKETSYSSMVSEEKRVSSSSQWPIELSSKINFLKGASLPATSQVPNTNAEISFEEQVKSREILKKENRESLAVVVLPKVAAENPQSQEENYDDNLEMDMEDPFMPHLFLILERFATFRSYVEFLKSSAQTSRFQLSESFITEKVTEKIVCTIARQIENGTMTLGVGKDFGKRGAKEAAAKEALKMLLQRCYTIEIKKRAAGEEEISLEELGCPTSQTDGGPDNVGARIMKLMGWTGGPLGKEGQGIREPIQALAGLGRLGIGLRVPIRPKVIGRRYLGITNEYHPSLTFHNAVTKLLDQMMDSLRNQPDEVIPDLVFSSELSNFQRKHIHVTIREDYRHLKSISYGQDEDRFLVVKPKISCENLFHRIRYQGGYTEKYVIHKPGTLTMEDIKKRDDNDFYI